MYNRYIPQSDGSYHRSRVPDAAQPKKPPEEPAQPQARQSQSAGGFLRQLLPKDMDTGDLLVVILLLLMAEDGTGDRNTALLTLALYFMM